MRDLRSRAINRVVCIMTIEQKIQLPLLECPHCHHRWHPRTEQPVHCPNCNYRLAKNAEEQAHLRNEYRDPRGGMSMEPAIETVNIPFDQIDDRNALQAAKEDAQKVKIKQQLALNAYFLNAIKERYYGEGGRIEFLNLTVEEHLANTSKWNRPQYQAAIGSEDDAIKNLYALKGKIKAFTDRDPQIKAMWSNEPIMIRWDNGDHGMACKHSHEEIDQVVELGKEEAAICDFFIDYHTKLREGYALKLQQLTPPSREKLNEIRDAVKAAERLKKQQIKMVAEYRKKDAVSDKNAVKYAKLHEQFTVLRETYNRFFREIAPFTSGALPAFPELSIDERGGEGFILDAAKKAGWYPIPNKLKRGWDY